MRPIKHVFTVFKEPFIEYLEEPLSQPIGSTFHSVCSAKYLFFPKVLSHGTRLVEKM